MSWKHFHSLDIWVFLVFSLDSVSQIVMNELFIHPPKVKYYVSKLLLWCVLSLLTCMYWPWGGSYFCLFVCIGLLRPTLECVTFCPTAVIAACSCGVSNSAPTPECYFILSLCCAELETPYEPTAITALSQNVTHSSDGPERPIHTINRMSRNNWCDMT